MPLHHASLVINGHAPSEQGESDLVWQALARKGHGTHEWTSGVPWLPWDGTRWSLVWFAGHCTIYRSCQRGSLEQRDGSRFLRLFTHEEAKLINTRVLVLSSCNTAGGPFAGEYAADWVIGHEDTVYFEDSLVFAARFVPMLLLYTPRSSYLSDTAIKDAFSEASHAVAPVDTGWHLQRGHK